MGDTKRVKNNYSKIFVATRLCRLFFRQKAGGKAGRIYDRIGMLISLPAQGFMGRQSGGIWKPRFRKAIC